jgi:DNA-binding transcriptional MerR regulator
VTDVTDDSDALTIDALAQRTGMTVRNLRAHQARGLLPPPDVRGRTGYYGADHVARIELIKELQADGFNLEAIRKLLGAPGSSAEFLRFTRAVRQPFEEEEPEIVELGELAESFGADAPNTKMLEQALKLGMLRDLGEGRYEQRSPRLGEIALELRRLGVSPEQMVKVTDRLHRHADGAARAFVDLFLEEVWKPFEKEGRPPERWPEVLESLERLRPLATDAVLSMFAMVMTERVEKAFGREIEKVSKGR